MVLTPGKFCLVREIDKNNNSDLNWEIVVEEGVSLVFSSLSN